MNPQSCTQCMRTVTSFLYLKLKMMVSSLTTVEAISWVHVNVNSVIFSTSLGGNWLSQVLKISVSWKPSISPTSKHIPEKAKYGLTLVSSLYFACHLFHPLGPFTVNDTFAKGAVIAMQLKSLDQGSYSHHVQFEMFWNFWSAVSNIFHNSVKGQDHVFGKRHQETGCHQTSDYSPFLLEIMKPLEHDWTHCPPPH